MKEECEPDITFILLAALCGGNSDIIRWCIPFMGGDRLNKGIQQASKICGNGKGRHVSLDSWKLVAVVYTGDMQLLDKAMPDEYKCVVASPRLG